VVDPSLIEVPGCFKKKYSGEMCMNVRLLGGMILVAGCFALVLGGCEDQGSPPGEDPVTVSRSSVVVVPGTSVNVTVMGGRPPYYVSQQGEGLVATGAFVDSTVSPAVFQITAPNTASIDDNTTITVADADERNEGGASQRTAHGENEAAIFVSIAAVGNISYSDDIQPIWDGSCQAACHQAGGIAPFSLDRFVSWTNIWFAPVTNQSCGMIYRVVGGSNGGAGNPDSSLLFLMVDGTTSCPRMPFSPLDPGDTLSQIDQEKIESWIRQGAQNN